MIGSTRALTPCTQSASRAKSCIIARQLQCNKCLIGLFTRLHTASDMTFTHNGGIFARSPKHSKVRKGTRLQLWCELFPWALGIINQPLQYRGHEEVAVFTKVLKEAER